MRSEGEQIANWHETGANIGAMRMARNGVQRTTILFLFSYCFSLVFLSDVDFDKQLTRFGHQSNQLRCQMIRIVPPFIRLAAVWDREKKGQSKKKWGRTNTDLALWIIHLCAVCVCCCACVVFSSQWTEQIPFGPSTFSSSNPIFIWYNTQNGFSVQSQCKIKSWGRQHFGINVSAWFDDRICCIKKKWSRSFATRKENIYIHKTDYLHSRN